MSIEEQVFRAVQDGIRDGVKSKISGYQSPIDGLIADCLKAHNAALRELLNSAISSALGVEEFREEIRQSVRGKLASLLVARFGGELEKQVNALKSDPATRARITLAIEQIVGSQ